MEIIYQERAIADLLFWKINGPIKIQNKITKLLKDIVEHPFTGFGKPEPLKYNLRGAWSRKINNEHR